MRSPRQFGDAETFRVLHFFQQNVRALRLAAEFVGRLADAAFDDVVAQNDADLLAIGEMFGQRQRVGDAAFAFLIGVIDVLQSEMFAVGQQSQEIRRNSGRR